jgi:ABC-2 type transport system permease protein
MDSKVQRSLRVVLAIAAKDIVDAIKNKSILSQVFTVMFIIVLYRFLPSFENGDALPRLVLYDAGSSKRIAELEGSASFDLVVTDSQAAMEAYVEDMDTVVLGLVLPSDFDDQNSNGQEIELEGYVVHWASDKKISEVQSFFEEKVEEIVGNPVRIHNEGNIVYSIPDSRGFSFLTSLTAVLVMVIAGAFIVPILVLEEKENKTLDALLVSPADPSLVLLGKAFSGSIYCIIAVGAVLVLNHSLVTHWWLSILAALCGVAFNVGVGLLLGSIFEVKQQLTLWGFVLINILGIPMFLSIMDDIIPTSIMAVIHLIPTVALAKVFRVSFSNSASLSLFGPELAIILTGTLIIFTAMFWVIRRSDR